MIIIFVVLVSCWAGDAWSHTPVHNYVVVLLDASGSMNQSDPQFLRRDATKLLINLLRPGDRVILAEFGFGVRGLTDGAITLTPESQSKLFTAINKLSSRDRYTDILGAFQYAYNLISMLPPEVRQSFLPVVILLTDGRDDMPGQGDRRFLIEAKIHELANLGVKVHTVGFSGRSDMQTLKRAANLTGGDLWVINQAGDLLRGFFGLSRVLGNRWPLLEQSVSRGTAKVTLPEWSRRLVACYLPSVTTSERARSSAPITREIITPSYQILRFNDLPSNLLEFTLPASGTLLIDAEETLILQAHMGKKVPARLPFLFQAHITPARDGELGRPLFLAQTVLTLRLRHEGRPEITLTLYDDGQYEDGQAGDGRFGGFVSGLDEGSWNFLLTARTPHSPTLSVAGQLEALTAPVSVESPSLFSQLIFAPFTGRLHWKTYNLTEVPLTGEMILISDKGEKSSQALIWKGGEYQRATFVLPRDMKEGAAGLAVLRLSRQAEPIWEGKYNIRPWWVTGGIFIGVIGLVGLTFIFPRRSLQGSTLTVTATVAGENLFRILRVNRDGRVEASDLPQPLNDPGTFRARSGLWRRGIMYEPAPWCQPNFPGKRPPRKGHGYLLQGPATWRCASEQIQVEYRLNPRF